MTQIQTEFSSCKNIHAFYNADSFAGQLKTMLTLQNEANEIMGGANWRERNLAFHRAIYVEAIELIEHMGAWKWWKKGKPNVAQATMELIDIWHFAMSWAMVRFDDPVQPDAVEKAILKQMHAGVCSYPWGGVPDEVEFRNVLVDSLVRQAGANFFGFGAFVYLMAATGLDFNALFECYIGKNALNRFRQSNGDKAGTYARVWGGQEDNVHLDEILLALKGTDPAQMMGSVLAQLQLRYDSLIKTV